MKTPEEFTEQLETELSQITEQLKTIARYEPETGDWIPVITDTEVNSADANVIADATEDWDTSSALLVQLETRYRNLVRALQKLTDGTYGVCEISGEPIEPERLAANPAARTTIANRDRESELPL